MYVGRDFDVANPTESEVYSLDFGNGLQSGESIAVASITITVFQGVELQPLLTSFGIAGHIAIGDGRVAAHRRFGRSDLFAGVTYTGSYTVTTNLTNTITLYSRIPCRAIN